MTSYLNHTRRTGTLAAAWMLFCVCAAAFAAEPGKVPNVMILATGGTIAGTGASSTATVGYQSATVGVQRLIEPRLEQVKPLEGQLIDVFSRTCAGRVANVAPAEVTAHDRDVRRPVRS